LISRQNAVQKKRLYGLLPDKERMSTKTERLEVRVTPEHKQLIEHAAAVSGQVVSQFVVPIVLRRAERILRRFEWTVLAGQDRAAFLEILQGDEPPTPALRAAFERYGKSSG
jgi:uncharacterized protein (DUF1778 family)